MKKQFFLIALFFLVFNSLLAQQVFNVKEYGAVGLKSQLATTALQKTIDACHEAGGGTVFLPAGEYLSGTIVMKSNVSLHIGQGATLFASQDSLDYIVPFEIHKHSKKDHPVLIYADGARNISIEGMGEINGQARRVFEDLKAVDGFIASETENARKSGVEMKMYYKVPPYVSLIYLVSCQDVKISDLRIMESVDWTLHIQWSDRVNIRNCYIQSSLDAGVNADGIDIDGSRDVTVSDCIIETGDDAIVLKSTLTNNRFESCENIVVTNCVLSSTSTALKIGTETFGDFRNILFSNCAIKNTNRGFSIVVRDGGAVSDVIVSNITMNLNRKHFNYWGDADPIWLVILKRNEDSKIGSIENVMLENIIAHGQGTSKIEGYAGSRIKNVMLNNVQLFMYAEDRPDKRSTHALVAKEVENLSLEQCSIFWDKKRKEEGWKSAFYAEEVNILRINNFYGIQGLAGKEEPVIALHNVNNVLLSNIEPQEATDVLVKVSGNMSQKVHLNNSDLRNLANKKMINEKGVKIK